MPTRNEVLETWQETVVSLGDHAKLGQSLQRRGLQLMKDAANLQAKEAASILREARELIRDGVRIEANAKMERYRMERNKPHR